jgi:hypothetical protein
MGFRSPVDQPLPLMPTASLDDIIFERDAYWVI